MLTPPSAYLSSTPGSLRYPAWLAGNWQVTNTNGQPALSLPLGPRFVDPLLINAVQRTNTRRYRVRFVDSAVAADAPSCGPTPPDLPVQQDRRFNTMQEDGAFLAPSGFVVEGGAYACGEKHPHGRVVLDILDTDATAGVRAADTSGSAVEVVQRVAFRSKSELEVVWAGWEAEPDRFVTSEMTVQRDLLPDGEEMAASFFELLTRFERGPSEDMVTARYRVVQYLGFPELGVARPRSSSRAERALEKDAAGRAIAVLDYDLRMERV